MEISGSYTLYAPRERVWTYMLDPTVLARTVPGCEELEQEAPDRLRGRLKVGIASVKGTYNGTLRILERVEPTSCRIQVDGKGTTGTIHGEGLVRLEARGPTTTFVTYEGQAQLGGPIASVGSRVLTAAARMLVNQFFARLADVLDEAPMPPGNGTSPADRTAASAAAATPAVHSAAGVSEATWSAGLPEARPLEVEQVPSEARPLEAAPRPEPAPAPSPPLGAPAASARVNAASLVPAPGFLTQFVRQAGLSDGSSESERRVARQMLAAGVGALAATLALAFALLSWRRRGR